MITFYSSIFKAARAADTDIFKQAALQLSDTWSGIFRMIVNESNSVNSLCSEASCASGAGLQNCLMPLLDHLPACRRFVLSVLYAWLFLDFLWALVLIHPKDANCFNFLGKQLSSICRIVFRGHILILNVCMIICIFLRNKILNNILSIKDKFINIGRLEWCDWTWFFFILVLFKIYTGSRRNSPQCEKYCLQTSHL